MASAATTSGFISSIIAGGDANYSAQAGDYLFLMCLLCVVSFALFYQSRFLNKEQLPAEFVEFQKKFMVPYALMVGADWVQAPFVYKLYSFYGYSKGEIGFLYVVGYIASAVLGTFIAGLADRFGRKRLAIFYGFIFTISCLSKHSTDFNTLLFARVLAGISTTILHSTFESWLISEHRHHDFPEEWISRSLSLMSFMKGGIAIASAIIANSLASHAGYVAPFDLAALMLIFGSYLIHRTWRENFGDPTLYYGRNFSSGWIVLASNPRVWLLGVIQSCFEGAVFLFVFTWTPFLEATHSDIPHGLIFASFMFAIMVGSHAHELLSSKIPNEAVATITFGVAAFCLLIPGVIRNHWINLLFYVLFEICVGLYFPCIGSQRAKHIPNEYRSTIMSYFRIPLNVIIVVSLLNVSQMSGGSVSKLCAGMVGVSCLSQIMLGKITGQDVGLSSGAASSKDSIDEP